MVIDQGTILDRIDYNIEQTNIHLESGHKELEKVVYFFKFKAHEMQKGKAALYCIIVLSVVVLIMIIILIYRFSNK